MVTRECLCVVSKSEESSTTASVPALFFVRVGVCVRFTFHRHAHSAHVFFFFQKVSVEQESV